MGRTTSHCKSKSYTKPNKLIFVCDTASHLVDLQLIVMGRTARLSKSYTNLNQFVFVCLISLHLVEL